MAALRSWGLPFPFFSPITSFLQHSPPFTIWLSLRLFAEPVIKVLKMWLWLSLLVTLSAKNDVGLLHIFSCDSSSALPLQFSLSVLLGGVRNILTECLCPSGWWHSWRKWEVEEHHLWGTWHCRGWRGSCTDGKMKGRETASAGAMTGSPWCDVGAWEMAWGCDLLLSFAFPAVFGGRIKRWGSAK